MRRRGERIRRRRRMATALLGALVLVVPVSAAVTLLGAESDGGVALTATAPPPAVTGDSSRPETSATVVEGQIPGAAGAATPEATPPSGGPSPTTTAEVGGGIASVNGSPRPPSPTSVPPGDDPVVRAPSSVPAGPSSAPAGSGSAAGGLPPGPAGPPTAPPTNDAPQPGACPAAEVNVTVTTEKGRYGPGETVRGSSTLENRSATTCLLPTRAFFRIVDAGGRTVGSFAYTLELRLPVKAEPGKTFTSTFTWGQRDCSGSSCAQVPAGTYVAVADWNESGPYSGRASFEITA